MVDISNAHDSNVIPLRDRLFVAFLAIGLGLLILFATGFVPVEAIHNAAHDGRHVLAFPCH